ncbi:prepilin-type N-terminal cleavage/methylation domain-containing protein [Vibrio aestuarianus]|uniref:prepilin-type N-terminal cleavage/methylation domain-containing protein n=1 Tax=Vibrio aestuarianus TaxID=28171 RepID=UPI00237CC8E7|nr:prepilin-type N-terminal cleavage/methylation domain-containing protein [Vibrio aestuarianus]MDE1262747.1 prepilin-type N-terminal cleavage/methylation domain-containing protein [Vibrio aestuarianus]MDE1295116.1 prepilin-type N-terminal cleavage/methylation domain-containing protein [Vibrio aestuarianus]
MKDIQNRNRRNSNKKVRGLALLEILIAIGILGIISAGVATLASRTFEEQNASLVNKSVADLSISIKKAFSRSGGYSNATNVLDTLVAAGAVAAESARNPMSNSNYGYAAIQKLPSAASGSAFVITIEGLPDTLCRKIATGPLLQDAAYLEVAAANATVPTDLDETLNFPLVLKSLQGTDSKTNDPLEYATLCTNGDNTIFYGAY